MLQPLRGKLLVDVIPTVRMTVSGLHLADNIIDIPHRGMVITLGIPFQDGKGRIHEWDIKEGEIVHFKRNWGSDKDKYIILMRDDIFCVERLGHPIAVRDMVIIKRVYSGKIGTSSLVIPEGFGIQSNLEDYHGEVISVGIENKMGVNIGDKILYSRNEGLGVKLPTGEEYFSIKPRAILARV